jgi:hypothetical protein
MLLFNGGRLIMLLFNSGRLIMQDGSQLVG